MTFKNADNEIEQYTIKQVYIDKEEKYAWNCKCRREDAHMYFGGDKTRRIEGSFSAQTKTKYQESELQIVISFNNIEGNDQKSFSQNTLCNPFSESIVNDIGDTIMIANELGNVTIVRNKGITEYTIDGTKWTLVE